MARPKNDFETFPARVPVGTTARIAPLLTPPETRADFIRQAIEREIKRRSRQK